MALSRSSFYYKPKDTPDGTALVERIERVCLVHPRYGYRRVTCQLRRDGILVNHKKVLRLMKQHDLLCQVKRRWVTTTDSKHNWGVYLKRHRGK